VTLHQLALAFESTAALVAVVVAWKRSEHRPVAAFLAGTVVADLVRLGLSLGPLAISGPYKGPLRALFHVEQALFLTWPAGIAALALWVYRKRHPFPVAIAYALAVAVLVIGYPAIRGDLLRRCYLAAEIAAVVTAIGAFVRWVGRAPPRLPQVVTTFVLVVDMVSLAVGPWQWGLFGAWALAQVIYSALYAVLIVVQIGALWISPSSSKWRP
jgi:hypothetical protein